MDSFALLPTSEVTPLDFLDPNRTVNPADEIADLPFTADPRSNFGAELEFDSNLYLINLDVAATTSRDRLQNPWKWGNRRGGQLTLFLALVGSAIASGCPSYPT